MLTPELLSSLRAAYAEGGPSSLVKAASGLTSHCSISDLWCGAMNEQHGIEMHESWKTAEGPDADCIRERDAEVREKGRKQIQLAFRDCEMWIRHAKGVV
jgi:hypothetical protein